MEVSMYPDAGSRIIDRHPAFTVAVLACISAVITRGASRVRFEKAAGGRPRSWLVHALDFWAADEIHELGMFGPRVMNPDTV